MGTSATRNLNVTKKQLRMFLGVAAVVIAIIAQFFSQPNSYVPGIFWTLLGLDALRYGRKTYKEAKEDDEAVTQAHLDGPVHVAAVAARRREFLWIPAQVLLISVGFISIVILGSHSLEWPGTTNDFWQWFQETLFPRFFVGSFLYVQFIMWLNRRLDSTVAARMRIARALDQGQRKTATIKNERARVKRKKK